MQEPRPLYRLFVDSTRDRCGNVRYVESGRESGHGDIVAHDPKRPTRSLYQGNTV